MPPPRFNSAAAIASYASWPDTGQRNKGVRQMRDFARQVAAAAAGVIAFGGMAAAADFEVPAAPPPQYYGEQQYQEYYEEPLVAARLRRATASADLSLCGASLPLWLRAAGRGGATVLSPLPLRLSRRSPRRTRLRRVCGTWLRRVCRTRLRRVCRARLWRTCRTRLRRTRRSLSRTPLTPGPRTIQARRPRELLTAKTGARLRLGGHERSRTPCEISLSDAARRLAKTNVL